MLVMCPQNEFEVGFEGVVNLCQISPPSASFVLMTRGICQYDLELARLMTDTVEMDCLNITGLTSAVQSTVQCSTHIGLPQEPFLVLVSSTTNLYRLRGCRKFVPPPPKKKKIKRVPPYSETLKIYPTVVFDSPIEGWFSECNAKKSAVCNGQKV